MVWLKEGRFVTRHTGLGFPYVDWEPPVPRIRDQILDCVVYLYPTKAAAEVGVGAGGSGFLLRVPCSIVAESHFNFVVTNRHVTAGGATVVRLNTKDGRTDTIEPLQNRIFESKTDDLAIIMLPTIPQAYQINSIGRECLVSKEFVAEHGIGVGDDALMVGRFINRDGEQKNTPTARFGNISQMLGDPISVTIDGKEHVQEEAFLVEVRSIGGYSGSPVFVLPNLMYDRPGKKLPLDRGIILGVDFCHLRNWHKARDAHGDDMENILVPENTGMAGVVPAWKVEDLLKTKEVQNLMKACEEHEVQRQKLTKMAAADVASPPSIDANPTHREDFNSLVSAAARKREPED